MESCPAPSTGGRLRDRARFLSRQKRPGSTTLILKVKSELKHRVGVDREQQRLLPKGEHHQGDPTGLAGGGLDAVLYHTC